MINLLARGLCRRLRSGESGQTLVFAVFAMVATIGMGAFAIDIARWYQKHHQDQVASDAASLAAANCLSHPGRTVTVNTPTGSQQALACTSTTDAYDAKQVAVDVAYENGVSIPTANVSLVNGVVSVDGTTSAPALLAGIAGVQSGTQEAGASALVTPAVTNTITNMTTSSTVATSTQTGIQTTVSSTVATSTQTGIQTTVSSTTATSTNTTVSSTVGISTNTTVSSTEATSTQTTLQTTVVTTTATSTATIPGDSGTALVAFAMDSNCSDNGIDETAGSDTYNGGIHSNGSLFLDPGGGTYQTLQYGPGSGCKATLEGGGGNFEDGSAASSALLSQWPVPYNTSADPLPSCTYTYNGSGTWDYAGGDGPGVYCYPNGTILLTNTTWGTTAYQNETFICGSLSPQGGGGGYTMSAYDYPTNKLLIYATASTGTNGDTVYLTNGNAAYTGDIDTPNGDIGINAGSITFTGLLEAQDITLGGGNNHYTGDGPTTYGSTTTTTTSTGTSTITNTITNTTTYSTNTTITNSTTYSTNTTLTSTTTVPSTTTITNTTTSTTTIPTTTTITNTTTSTTTIPTTTTITNTTTSTTTGTQGLVG